MDESEVEGARERFAPCSYQSISSLPERKMGDTALALLRPCLFGQNSNTCNGMGMSEKLAYLGACIGPSTHHHADRQGSHTAHLQHAILLPAKPAHRKRRYTPKTPQNDMHRDTDVERKCPIVQHIDSEKHEGHARKAGERNQEGLEAPSCLWGAGVGQGGSGVARYGGGPGREVLGVQGEGWARYDDGAALELGGESDDGDDEELADGDKEALLVVNCMRRSEILGLNGGSPLSGSCLRSRSVSRDAGGLVLSMARVLTLIWLQARRPEQTVRVFRVQKRMRRKSNIRAAASEYQGQGAIERHGRRRTRFRLS